MSKDIAIHARVILLPLKAKPPFRYAGSCQHVGGGWQQRKRFSADIMRGGRTSCYAISARCGIGRKNSLTWRDFGGALPTPRPWRQDSDRNRIDRREESYPVTLEYSTKSGVRGGCLSFTLTIRSHAKRSWRQGSQSILAALSTQSTSASDKPRYAPSRR